MYRLFERMQELYKANPCRCKRCQDKLPFYHHKDHLCDACVVLEIIDALGRDVYEEGDVHYGNQESENPVSD